MAKNAKKDYFGDDWHGMWKRQTNDDIDEYIDDTPSMTIEIDVIPADSDPPMPIWEQMPERPKFPPPPRFPTFKNPLPKKLF